MTKPSAPTKAELHEMLAEAVRNTQPQLVRDPQRTMQAIPLVAPIIVSLNEPIVPGQSATAAFYEYYGGNPHCWN